jgi:hypothetical protein
MKHDTLSYATPTQRFGVRWLQEQKLKDSSRGEWKVRALLNENRLLVRVRCTKPFLSRTSANSPNKQEQYETIERQILLMINHSSKKLANYAIPTKKSVHLARADLIPIHSARKLKSLITSFHTIIHLLYDWELKITNSIACINLHCSAN